MKVITTQNSLSFDELVGDLLGAYQEDTRENRKKQVEVCHVGKLLLHLESTTIIDSRERPDFILNSLGDKVGLEHQIIIDPVAKEREGRFGSLFSQAERELRLDNDLPDFLVNCYIKPYVEFQDNDRASLITEIKTTVRQFVLSGMQMESRLIDRMFKQPHTIKAISPNLGAWWQKAVTKEIIEEAVAKKEVKLQSYNQETGHDQWLLLVIGGVGDSSYEMDRNLEIRLNTTFSKVYLLEDFRNVLYELK